jgi:hypothetical protein
MPDDKADNLTLNQGLDGVIDMSQGLKNVLNALVNTGGKGLLDGKDEINDLLDKLIDKLQAAKG